MALPRSFYIEDLDSEERVAEFFEYCRIHAIAGMDEYSQGVEDYCYWGIKNNWLDLLELGYITDPIITYSDFKQALTDTDRTARTGTMNDKTNNYSSQNLKASGKKVSDPVNAGSKEQRRAGRVISGQRSRTSIAKGHFRDAG